MIKRVGAYLWEVLVAFDRFMNIMLAPLLNLFVSEGGYKFGGRSETISTAFAKNVQRGTCGLCVFMCRALHLLDRNHCKESIEADRWRGH